MAPTFSASGCAVALLERTIELPPALSVRPLNCWLLAAVEPPLSVRVEALSVSEEAFPEL